MSPEE
jgi:hypothetical protein